MNILEAINFNDENIMKYLDECKTKEERNRIYTVYAKGIMDAVKVMKDNDDRCVSSSKCEHIGDDYSCSRCHIDAVMIYFNLKDCT